MEAAELRGHVLDCLFDGVVCVDTEHKIVYANERLGVFSGHDHASLIGQPLEVLIPAPHRSAHRTNVTRFFADPTPRRMGGSKFPLLRKDGKTLAVQVGLSAFVHPISGLHCVACLRDVSGDG